VPTPANISNNNLLVVEDEKDFLALVAHLAQGVGFDVKTASNAETFREQVQRCAPSIVLLDLQIPGMDGVEALRHLARLNSPCSVALISAMDQRVLSSARRLGESLGLNMLGAVQKPAMLEDIEALLVKHRGLSARVTRDDLRRAIEDAELTVHYHPKLAREQSRWFVCGAEALVRWRHPELGLLYPREFLHLADDHAMTAAIADFVLTDAVRQAGQWRSMGLNLSVAVNLASRLAHDLEFPDRLARILQEYNLAPEQLILEVVEESSQHDAEIMMDVFTRLRVKGVGLSLDDFGVGASSLTHLAKMPFSEVKIDCSLIATIPQARSATTMVRAIVQLAHALSLRVCAEGVETAVAFDLLDEIGCDHLQGDFIGKPKPPGEFESFVLAWSGGQMVKSA